MKRLLGLLLVMGMVGCGVRSGSIFLSSRIFLSTYTSFAADH